MKATAVFSLFQTGERQISILMERYLEWHEDKHKKSPAKNIQKRVLFLFKNKCAIILSSFVF